MSPNEINRRDILKSAAAMGLSFVLPGMSARAAERRKQERPKSLIVLWMEGGPSQLEMWDPHPGTKIGGPTRAISTTLRDLQIGADLPHMAEQMEHLSVVRSLVSQEGDHERAAYFVKTGYRPETTLTHPSLTAIVTRELRSSRVEIPQHVSLAPGQWPARGGYLGAGFDAFKIFDPGRNIRNMKAVVADKRQSRRLKNLDLLNNSFARGRRIPASKTLHQDMIQSAIQMMSREQLKAFKLEDEAAETISAYGDSAFGRGCLVARRLVETGVRAIEVTLTGFDTHADNFGGHKTQNDQLDPAFAALIKDLRERDLLDSTVVLCIGEFGRTPRINPAVGRDHWPSGFSCVLGGGGLASGQIIGATDPTGEKKKPEDPIKVEDLYATILTTLGIDPAHEEITPVGRPMAYTAGEPIARLLANA